MQESTKGLIAAISAFGLWGILPIYLKALTPASPVEILCHRIVWSVVATFSLLLFWQKAKTLLPLLRGKKVMGQVVITSLLVSANWVIYIWAVNSGYIVEASLGYYINPLVNVLLGLIFLQERLRPGQWLAISFAFSGVCYLTFFYGQFPWIALTLAFSFAFYGLFRKISSLPPIEGLCLETSLLSIPALAVFAYLAMQGQSDFMVQTTTGRLLLAGTGIITSLPLILFAFAAHRLPLSTLGIVQYLAPTLQLLIGIFVYKEPFPEKQMMGFVLVWCGLVIFATEGVLLYMKQQKACTTATPKGQKAPLE